MLNPSLVRTGQCIFCATRSLTRGLSSSGARARLGRQDGRRLKESRAADRAYGNTQSRISKSERRLDGVSTVHFKFATTNKDDVLGSRLSDTLLEEIIRERLNAVEKEIFDYAPIKRLQIDNSSLTVYFRGFRYRTNDQIRADRQEPGYILSRLKSSVPNRTVGDVDKELLKAFFCDLVTRKFTSTDLHHQTQLANLGYPAEWYPATRQFRREIHAHVGPTNSGKTYHALKRLEAAKSGIYAGPLRLLAHEVFMRLNARGLVCNLITGDEQRCGDEDRPIAPLLSCTVEMVPLSRRMDVAVIDEIQMIGSEDRGWAWTQALLGIQARELHVCGEERSIPILEELAAMTGEKLHVHRYKRLSPLKMMKTSLDGDFQNLRKGDCVVAFSVIEIHSLRQKIESTLNIKVAVIYGTLPPETRAQQARLFNDPDNNYDILVASNAVGMGLNLDIKRMIFHSSAKFDGSRFVGISTAEVKQIAGRAGRYSTAENDMKQQVGTETITLTSPPRSKTSPKTLGLVTTLEQSDFRYIATAMASDPEPMVSAGILPPAYVIERFSKYYPKGTPLSYILFRLQELGRTNARFFICDQSTQLSIADAIHDVEGLTVNDRLIFCSAPIEPKRLGEAELARVYASFVANSQAVNITDVEELELELLEDQYKPTRDYLKNLERLHKGVIVWNWLSYRFAGVFMDRELSMHIKELVEHRIEEVLHELSLDYDSMRENRLRAVLDVLETEQESGQESIKGDTGVEDAPEDEDEEAAAEESAEYVVGESHQHGSREEISQPKIDSLPSEAEERSQALVSS